MKKITVAIPTYKRNELLKELLLDLNNQSYKNFKVIVSNDDSLTTLSNSLDHDDYEYELEVIDNIKNIGLVFNYLKLLNLCETEYFMWLADDDKISHNYLELNLKFLENNNDYCCSVGQWIQLKTSNKFIDIPSIDSDKKIQRFRSFISINSDHFIYGLFRYGDIKKYKFYNYFFPNHKVVENWCFPFLIQFLCKKKFNVESRTMYLDNILSAKHYLITRNSIIEKFRYKIRRLNVYLLYILFYFYR
jgi:glycosyltransferase involved in cell wall biosynthesis